MSRNFIIQDDVTQTMSMQGFRLETTNNMMTLCWEWPRDVLIRMALVFECREEDPDLKTLIETGHPHEVVMRDLASHLTKPVPKGRVKYLICPAYFEDNKAATPPAASQPQSSLPAHKKNIAVCNSPYVTDWIYEKISVTALVEYSPLPLSQFHKAAIKITPATTPPEALSYKIKEQQSTLDTYPLDAAIIANGGYVYIKKTQQLDIILHQDYAHLIDMMKLP